MGISGLLPLLAPATRTVHLRDLAGTRIGIDAYVWLHKGAFGCALELHLNRAAADGYVTYCMKRIDLLKKHNIVPVVVFDGGCLPMKRGTELERRRKRDAYKARAVEELDKGNRTKALELFQSCLDVTPWMAHNLIKVLRERNIEFVVAPYEADAQLAYLDKIGYVNAVLTEDSDLVVFGCRRVILKLDAQGGAVEVNADELGKIPDFKGWTFEKFRQACILSGCDYVPSLKGIGLKKAIEAIGRHGSIDNATPAIRRGYEHEVRMAEKTFLHQRVYDPLQRKLVPLNPIEDGNDVRALYFIGP
ncbi:PIN domain-like protein [Zopfochytrium polystomum]|nr:PIN domain-like protein [Zopfochytrium polystomum]